MKQIICTEEKTEPIEFILKKVDDHCLIYVPGKRWPFIVYDDYPNKDNKPNWENMATYLTIDDALEWFNSQYCND